MEILFVSHKYPPATGGMEKQSYELITGMSRYARVHSIVYEGQEHRLLFFLKLSKRISSMCRAHPGIRLIHFNDALIATMCLWHRSYGHVARVVTVHGLDVVFPLPFYQKYLLPRFNRFDLIIAVSQATADACMARGIDPRKLTVIHNGVDTTLPHPIPKHEAREYIAGKFQLPMHDRTVLVSIGRPVRRKGYSWLTQEVMPRLGPGFIYLIAGPFHPEPTVTSRLVAWLPGGLRQKVELFFGLPSDEDTLRKLLAPGKQVPAVYQLGKLSDQDLRLLLSAADAFLMPNIPVAGDMEGFGLVCLEASLQGALVLAAGIDGIVDAVHHQQNGTIIPAADVTAWVNTLNRLNKDDHADWPTASQVQQYTRQHFGWEKTSEAYYRAFISLVFKKY